MKDPLTGEEFEPKKRSQKFACAANRIRYNNKKANELRVSRAYIDAPLNNSHNLLRKLMEGKSEATFHSEFLDGKGVDFRVCNHQYNYSGRMHYCIYEFIIIPELPDNIKIVKK